MQTLNNQSITNLLNIIRNLLGKLIEAVKQKELCWAAGLVDGEGCITAVKQTYKSKNGKQRKPTYRLKLMVNQNCYSTMEKLQSILDEKSYLTEMPMREFMNAKVYQLQFDGINALNAINKLEPFLHRKKQHVIISNKLWEEGQMGVHPGRNGFDPEVLKTREKLVNRLKKLH